MAGFKDQIEPMTLGNMRANGVRVRDRPPQRGLVAGTEKRDLRPGRSGDDPSPLPLPIGSKADVDAVRLSFQLRAFGTASDFAGVRTLQ
jgi:hypothetical protein